MRKRRLDRGLLQREVAAQIGVNKDTIYNWETNRTTPEAQFIPKIINFLGFAPYDPGWSFGLRLKAMRTAVGLSQQQLARRTGLDEGTIAKWEREDHKPRRKTWEDLLTFVRGLN